MARRNVVLVLWEQPGFWKREVCQNSSSGWKSQSQVHHLIGSVPNLCQRHCSEVTPKDQKLPGDESVFPLDVQLF